MDINLLVLNVGNSRLALGTFVGGELRHVARVGHDRRSDWVSTITEAWRPVAELENAAIAAAGVNPPLIEPIEHAAQMASGGARVEWVGRDIDVPVKVKTTEPDQTGIDRVLNVAAAYEQLGKACVVVDAGTAITIDCCNDEGDFIGGAIAPGVSLQLDSLHEHTAKLPRPPFATPVGEYGTSTEQAILHGVYHGIRGMVKELVERYATALGTWPDVIATGGDAPVLFGGWELVHAVSSDLTLYGIALAYSNHHIKHGT